MITRSMSLILFLILFIVVNLSNLSCLEIDYKNISPNFTAESSTKIKKEAKFNTTIDNQVLEEGKISLFIDIFSEKKFLSILPEIYDLAKYFSTETFKNEHNRIAYTRQIFIMRNLNLIDLPDTIPLYDENYRNMAFPDTEFFATNVDDSESVLISTQKVPGPIENIRVKINSSNYNICDFSLNQLEKFRLINSVETKYLQKIVVTKLDTPKTPVKNSPQEMSQKNHSILKGSISISFFYEIESTPDILVVTHQISTIKKPMGIPDMILKMIFKAFTKGIIDMVVGSRDYFNEKM